MTDQDLISATLSWLKSRNNLSADCADLHISSSRQDSARWGDELARRCEPLRKAAERYARENGIDLAEVASPELRPRFYFDFCGLCGRPIEGRVFYQGGLVDRPAHQACAKGAEEAAAGGE